MSDPQPGAGYPRQQQPPNPSAGGPGPQQNPYAAGPQQYPQQPYPAAQQPWPQPPAPRRRGLSTGGVLAIVFGSVGVVLLAGVVLIVVVIAGVIQGETARPVYPSAAPTSSSGAYDIIDRPSYRAYMQRLTDMTTKYSDARDDGSIHQWVPATPTGDDYATAFVYILTDLKGATYFSMHGMTTDDDPAKLDAIVAGKDAEVTELERRFLAGEALGTKVTIKRSDGTVFVYDGNAGPNG